MQEKNRIRKFIKNNKVPVAIVAGTAILGTAIVVATLKRPINVSTGLALTQEHIQEMNNGAYYTLGEEGDEFLLMRPALLSKLIELLNEKSLQK